MVPYVARKLGQLALVLLLGSLFVWTMLALVPGDAADAQAGPDPSAGQIEAVRVKLGLDQPLPVQYVKWLGNAVQGDFGNSYVSDYPVSTLVGDRIPATIQLAVLAMLLSAVIAVPLGAAAAVWPRSLLARAVNVYCSLSLAIPAFWIGLLVIVAFSINLGWIPSLSQYVPIFADPALALENLIGPMVVLAIGVSGVLVRFTRSAFTEVLGSEFIRTAHAKGLPLRTVLSRHALRNAAIPIVTVFGIQLASVLGGVVIIEAVFNYPGLGTLALTAVAQRDYPVIQAVMLFAVAAFVLINLAVDLIYAAIDPRVRTVADRG